MNAPTRSTGDETSAQQAKAILSYTTTVREVSLGQARQTPGPWGTGGHRSATTEG